MAELFGRRVELQVGNKNFNSQDFTIEFEIPFDDSPADNASKIRIYNLTDKTIRSFGKEPYVVVNAGYAGDVGAVLLGIGTGLITKPGSIDKVTEITALDGAAAYFANRFTKSYSKGIKASSIIADICRMTGVKIGKIELPKDVVYARGRSVSGKLSDCFDTIAKDCGTRARFQNLRLYMGPKGKGKVIAHVLDSDHGLIGSPSAIEKEIDTGDTKNPKKKLQGFRVVCLLNHRISTDALIQIKSKTANGRFWVDGGRHVCSDSDFLTEMDVYPQ